MNWMEKYPRKSKPSYNELLAFFQPDIRDLFLSFDLEIKKRFKVHNKYHQFSNIYGWTYGYGRSYSCELFKLIVKNNSFEIFGISIIDKKSFNKAVNEIEAKYNNGFEEYYNGICIKRRKNQIERTKKRLELEKNQMNKLKNNMNTEYFNKFNWSKKVSRNALLQLYQSEAKGMINNELLDEIGYTLFIRCEQARNARDLIDKNMILCLNCGLSIKCINKNDITICSCGYSYTYREYRRSCNSNNMPGGRAEPIFNEFMKRWPKCKDSKSKMLLIDWLIHKCHVTLMSGELGRSVCVNLIEGTKTQISELINKLAHE